MTDRESIDRLLDLSKGSLYLRLMLARDPIGRLRARFVMIIYLEDEKWALISGDLSNEPLPGHFQGKVNLELKNRNEIYLFFENREDLPFLLINSDVVVWDNSWGDYKRVRVLSPANPIALPLLMYISGALLEMDPEAIKEALGAEAPFALPDKLGRFLFTQLRDLSQIF